MISSNNKRPSLKATQGKWCWWLGTSNASHKSPCEQTSEQNAPKKRGSVTPRNARYGLSWEELADDGHSQSHGG